MSEQTLGYHLQKLNSYMQKLKETSDPVLSQYYGDKVKKHWLQGQKMWQQVGQPFLQFNPFVQINPHLTVQTQINPHLGFNMQTQINPHVNTDVQVNPKLNFDPDLNINVKRHKKKRR